MQVKVEQFVQLFRLFLLEIWLNTLTVTSPVVCCYVTNQTASSWLYSHETICSFLCSFLCILILCLPCEHFLMTPLYPLVFVRLLIYSTAASSELIQLAVPFSLVSSRSPWVCSNSSFEYFIFSCVRGAGTPLLIC